MSKKNTGKSEFPVFFILTNEELIRICLLKLFIVYYIFYDMSNFIYIFFII